jgi:hypothetical protein
MSRVRLTAINFARKNFKSRDLQFVDECIAEANFWLVILFVEFKQELFEKENTLAYIRMKIGYKLKEYWAPYATSTMSYIKKKGEQLPETVEFKEEDVQTTNVDIECFECLQSALRTELDWRVYEHHLLNETPKEIGIALQIRTKKVQKVLARIRKRLKDLERCNDADVSD